MGAVIGGLISFLLGLILILVIVSALWTVFIRVILPLGLAVLIGMGIYWVYGKITSPKEEKSLPLPPQDCQKALPDLFISPTQVEKI